MRKVVILGAHSALGRALFECIEERELELQLVRATTTEFIGPGLDLVDEAALRGAGLVILTFSGELAASLAEGAARLGAAVVDLTGTLPADSWVWPGIDPDAGGSLPAGAISHVPVGLAVPLVSVLRVLSVFGARRATICTYESAASRDQPGMDELAEQVRAVFAMQDVEPTVFGASLAFDCIPSLSGPGEPPEDADDRLAAELAHGLSVTGGVAKLELSVARVLVPTFSADAAMVEVQVEGTPDRETVEAGLRNGRGIRFEEGAPPSVDVVGRDDALVGRLRVGPGRIGLWVASDRLRRGSATLGALLVERWLA